LRALVLAMCAGAALMAVDAAPAEAQNARWGANYFPNVTLTTQDNRKVRFYDDLIKRKIVAVNLIYTSCKYACPLETARLAQVQRLLADRMGRDVFFYSITIDPAYDTPAVLKEYAAKFDAGRAGSFSPAHRKHRSDQPEDRTLLRAEPEQPRRPHAAPAGRQRGHGAVDSQLGRRRPALPGDDHRHVVEQLAHRDGADALLCGGPESSTSRPASTSS